MIVGAIGGYVRFHIEKRRVIKLKKWTITLIILPFSVFIISTSSATEKVELGLAETGPASLAYNLVAGVAENTNTKTNLATITAEATPDLKKMFGYKGEPPYKNIRGIAVAYTSNISWNAMQGINEVADLAGKKISLGSPRSLMEYFGGLGEISLPGIIYTRNRSSNDDPSNRYSNVCFFI